MRKIIEQYFDGEQNLRVKLLIPSPSKRALIPLENMLLVNIEIDAILNNAIIEMENVLKGRMVQSEIFKEDTYDKERKEG